MPKLTRLFVRIFIPITTLPIVAAGLSGCEAWPTTTHANTAADPSHRGGSDGLPDANDHSAASPDAVQAYLHDLNRLQQNRPMLQRSDNADEIHWIDARPADPSNPTGKATGTAPPRNAGSPTNSSSAYEHTPRPVVHQNPPPRVLATATQPDQPTVIIEGGPGPDVSDSASDAKAIPAQPKDDQAAQIQALMQSIEAVQAQAGQQTPGDTELTLDRLELCRKVSGFGIYEPFSALTFPAGREQKVIVYVELSGFEPTVMNDGYLETRLGKSIELFNEADGTSVWKRPEALVVDRSRNHRRDFFVVQMVTLPASLGLGRYRMKVRVRDERTGDIAERTLSLQMVEDRARPESVTEPVARTTAELRRSDLKQRELLEELQRVIGGVDREDSD